jgi:hypothetical protein
LDQPAFAGLHCVAKPLHVLTTVHAKSRGADPLYWLRGGRLRPRRLARQWLVSLGKSPRSE